MQSRYQPADTDRNRPKKVLQSRAEVSFQTAIPIRNAVLNRSPEKNFKSEPQYRTNWDIKAQFWN